jgi:hypothetical protein
LASFRPSYSKSAVEQGRAIRPSTEERKQLAEHIFQLSHKLLIALTSQPSSNEEKRGAGLTQPGGNALVDRFGGDSRGNALLQAWLVNLGAYRGLHLSPGQITKPKLGAIQYSLFSAVGEVQTATDAVALLALLQSAAARIVMDHIKLCGSISPSGKRGRPTSDAINILFTELMRCWEILTGKPPELTVNHLGEVTCPFCIFFHRYFGGNDRRLKARAIADRCRGLPPAGENLFSSSATD